METTSAKNHDDAAEKAARDARRALSRGEKWALRATILCGVLLLVAVPILMRRNAIPNIVIPPPQPLPSPNAFNFYVRAGTMVFKPAPAVYDKNAPLALLQSTAQNNAPALRKLRQGFAFSYRNPPQRSAAVMFPQYATFRELARQIQIESRVLAARGNWNGAMQSRLDGLRFGSDIPRGGTLIGALVGVAMEAIARKEAEKIVPHLSAQQARAAAKRLETIYANRVSPAEILQEEKWFGLTALKEAFATPNWRAELGNNAGFGEELTNAQKMEIALLSADTVVNNYTAMMETHIANARLPYGAPQQPLPKNLDFYTLQTSAIYEGSNFNYARNDAGNALLLTALALRAFQQERGTFPATLQELAPSYLACVPLDPFGRGAALRYRRKSNREYSLYSIGPDGKDDSGKVPLTRSGKPRRLSSPKARGDMVFGVNW